MFVALFSADNCDPMIVGPFATEDEAKRYVKSRADDNDHHGGWSVEPLRQPATRR